jgi:hypothetical protein
VNRIAEKKAMSKSFGSGAPFKRDAHVPDDSVDPARGECRRDLFGGDPRVPRACKEVNNGFSHKTYPWFTGHDTFLQMRARYVGTARKAA